MRAPQWRCVHPSEVVCTLVKMRLPLPPHLLSLCFTTTRFLTEQTPWPMQTVKPLAVTRQRSHLWATSNVLVWYKFSFVPTSLNMCSDAFHYKRPIDIAHTSLTGQRMNLQHLFLAGGQWTAIVLICKSVSSGSPNWCQQRQRPWAAAHHHRYFRAYSKAHMPTDVMPTTFIVWFLSVTYLTN